MKDLTALTFGVIVAAALSSGAAGEDRKAAVPKIVGKWTLTSGKKMGMDVDDNSKKSTYTIDKDKIAP